MCSLAVISSQLSEKKPILHNMGDLRGMIKGKISSLFFWSIYLVVVVFLTAIVGDGVLFSTVNESLQLPLKIVAAHFTLKWIRELEPNSKIWTTAFKIVLLLIPAAIINLYLAKFTSSLFFPKYLFTWMIKLNGVVHFLFDVSAVVFLWGILNIVGEKFQAKLRENELIKEKLQSELSLLKAQINPHLYFNTLNNVYSLALEKSDRTADMLLKLSNLMRYVLYECADAEVPLWKETKVIKDYLELERIRYNERLQLAYNEEIENGNVLISPLLFLPVVENCFKHGASNQLAGAQIDVSIRQKNNEIWLETYNSKDNGPHSSVEPGGIGLKNLKRQLELLYPERHRLNIEVTEHSYFFQLWIKLG
jgi:two-component system, LytTR family, sensor kinase